jgi:hypothetical protein
MAFVLVIIYVLLIRGRFQGAANRRTCVSWTHIFVRRNTADLGPSSSSVNRFCALHNEDLIPISAIPAVPGSTLAAELIID